MIEKLKTFYQNFKKDPDKYLLVLLVFLLPFERIPSVDIASVTVRPSLFVAGIIILRVLYLLYRKRVKFSFLTPQKILICFLVWIVLLIPEAINIKRAMAVVVFNSFTILTALSVGMLFKKQYIRPLLTSLFASAFVVSLLGLYQYPADLLGVPTKYTGLVERYRSAVFGFPRIQSVGIEPLYFASYLLLPISAAVSILLNKKQKLYAKTKWLWGLLLVLSTVVFLTVSRGGIYGTLVAAGVVVLALAFLRLTSWKKVGALVLVLVVGFGVSYATISLLNKTTLELGFGKGQKGTEFTSHIQDTGTEDKGDERANSRDKALDILKQNRIAVLIGIGPGQYGPYVQDNQPNSEGQWSIVNNLTLELLVELGLVGLALVVAFFGTVVVKLWLLAKRTKDVGIQVMALALVAFLIAEAMQYQTFSTLYIMQIWVAAGLGMGALLIPLTAQKKR